MLLGVERGVARGVLRKVLLGATLEGVALVDLLFVLKFTAFLLAFLP